MIKTSCTILPIGDTIFHTSSKTCNNVIHHLSIHGYIVRIERQGLGTRGIHHSGYFDKGGRGKDLIQENGGILPSQPEDFKRETWRVPKG